MIKCPTHIIDCLNERGVELIASASSYREGHEPEKSLTSSSSEYFFSGNALNQWWKVDLKHNVSAHSYYKNIIHAVSLVNGIFQYRLMI